MSPDAAAIVEFLTGSRMPAADVPWRSLRREDLRVVRAWAAETQAPPAQRRLLRCLRGLVVTASAATPNDGFDSATPPAPLRAAMGRRVPRRGISAREAKALLDACDPCAGAAGRRDRAVICLMLLAGLRRREVVALQRGDFDEATSCLRVRSRAGPTRLIVLHGDCLEAVTAWLQASDGAAGPLFVAYRRDQILTRALQPGAINHLLARRCRRAGCSPLTPRDLRAHFLWQLQAAARRDDSPRCRYQQTEDGEAAWVLPSLAAV